MHFKFFFKKRVSGKIKKNVLKTGTVTMWSKLLGCIPFVLSAMHCEGLRHYPIYNGIYYNSKLWMLQFILLSK